MNYRLIAVPDSDNNGIINSVDRDALISPVVNGDRTLSSAVGTDPCIFTQDFTPDAEGVSLPDLDVLGVPGQSGFSVSVQIPSAIAQQTSARPDCIMPREIVVDIGSRSEALAVRGRTRQTSGRVHFVNGSQFNQSRYFEARITNLDPNAERASGEFGFIDETQGANTILVAQGSFDMNY